LYPLRILTFTHSVTHSLTHLQHKDSQGG
jgi:hypothetical protein